MNDYLKRFLFNKGILINDNKGDNVFESLFSLANLFGIKITKGHLYADTSVIEFCEVMLGKKVPEAFYKGFPKSVLSLTKEQLLFDQLLHYTITYGFNDFSNPGHSVFEKDFEKIAFKEKVAVRNFAILTTKEAVAELTKYIEGMLASSRPLSLEQFRTLNEFINEYNYKIEKCACKDTIIRLLFTRRNYEYAKLLQLSDVIKIVELLCYEKNGVVLMKKLNLSNQDRKFIISIINAIFEGGKVNVGECYEKKAIWCGLLHHLHIKAKNEEMALFINAMRSKGNGSVYSSFEKAMSDGEIKRAVRILKNGKGQSVLLRNLNYILSRCKTDEEVDYVFNSISSKNAVLLIQLLMQYSLYKYEGGRIFKFTKFNLFTVHQETEQEIEKRKSCLSRQVVERAKAFILDSLKNTLKGKLNKVYVSKDMYNIAVPISETTSSGGFGVLPKGSRLKIESCKKLRAFTYWEKVNDIDLSAIGLSETGETTEFSWRTMYDRQSKEIVFSGDQTSGYDGGSEYFDVNLTLFKKKYPDIRYLVFSNNVYSQTNFSDCVCRAGYMIRDKKDSGNVFEPKTVKSSFTINAESTFAYLFGLDLQENEFIWLNMSRNSDEIVAGNTSMDFMLDYFKYTSIINLGTLFEMIATEIVEKQEEADVIVSDEVLELKEGVEQIKSCDFEKVTALLN